MFLSTEAELSVHEPCITTASDAKDLPVEITEEVLDHSAAVGNDDKEIVNEPQEVEVEITTRMEDVASDIETIATNIIECAVELDDVVETISEDVVAEQTNDENINDKTVTDILDMNQSLQSEGHNETDTDTEVKGNYHVCFVLRLFRASFIRMLILCRYRG